MGKLRRGEVVRHERTRVSRRTCEGEGCLDLAEPGRRLCRACRSRVARGSTPETLPHGYRYDSPRDRLRAAAIAYAEVSSEDDAAFKRADMRLWAAAKACR
jgi:hypothetical protein